MNPLQALVNLWNEVAWLFQVWIPSWWNAIHQDYEYIKNIGD